MLKAVSTLAIRGAIDAWNANYMDFVEVKFLIDDLVATLKKAKEEAEKNLRVGSRR